MHNQRTAHLFAGKPARPLLCLAACLMAVFSPRVQALGLGNIEARSYLGQPLQARIELLSRSPDELEGVSAQLASADSFQLVGLDRMAFSVPLRFLVHPDTPDAWIEVSSQDPVKDPVVQFVVEVNFANGRLLRQYTLFLDPPTVSAPAPMPALSSRPVQEQTPAPVSSEPEPRSEPRVVASQADLPGTSGEPAPAPDVREEIVAEALAAPESELKPEPAEPEPLEAAVAEPDVVEPETAEDTLVAEDVEPASTSPSPGEAPGAVMDEPEAAEAKPGDIAAPGRVAAYQVSQADLERYGPVRPGETLWSIASGVAQDTGLSVNQVMLAIQRYNPDAFNQDNINLLKSGAILRLPPPSEMDRMTAREAMLESMRQADDYTEIRAGRAPVSRLAPVLSDAAIEEPDSAQDYLRSAPGEDAGHLELVPPVESSDAGAGAGASTGDDATLDNSAGDPAADTTLLNEEQREAAALESEYLTERMQELQEELIETSAGIAVEDKGLAEMEQRLREERLAPPEPDVADGWSVKLGWLLLLPVALGVGVAFWWMRRRAGAAGAAAGVPGSAAETARAMADEAAEILEALDRDPEEWSGESVRDTADTPPHGTSRSQAAAPVITLEDYIGDIDRTPAAPVERVDEALDETAGHENAASRPEQSLADDEVLTQEDEEGEMPAADESDPETKLDLARAYISMGDAAAARDLLEEVLSEGNSAQVEEARSMMAEI